MAQPGGTRQEAYRLRISYILRFLLAMLLGRKRDLGPDIMGTLRSVRPRPRVTGDHYIPLEGPFVLVTNHYERRGLKVWWGGMLAANAIFERRETHRTLHWLMTSEWYNFRLGGAIPVPLWFLRWLFRRVPRSIPSSSCRVPRNGRWAAPPPCAPSSR